MSKQAGQPNSAARRGGALRLLCLLLGLTLVTLLAACVGSGDGLSGVAASTDVITPGSSGLGRPAGVLEVRYTLGQRSPVEVRLAGPVEATLLWKEQDAGTHVVRFDGVVGLDEVDGGLESGAVVTGTVRAAVPDGDYTITVGAGGTQQSVSFRVSGSDTRLPEIENILLRHERITPNSDALDDVSEVTFRTSETATVSVDLVTPDGQVIPALAPVEKGSGEQSVVISGQDLLGESLPDGTYTVTLRTQDEAGNVVEAQRPLRIEDGGKPQIAIVKVEITPRQIILGESISISITVRNTGNVPLRTQGPDRGYTYTTRDSYASVEEGKWDARAGLWRVGVDWDGNSGGPPYRYPFRWGFGKTLMPGEEVTTGGSVVVLKEEREMFFYAGVLQEGVSIVLDRLGRTLVEVDY